MTHPELKATFYLPIIGVKKNPTSPLYTSLGVLTKGTIIEVTILFVHVGENKGYIGKIWLNRLC